MVLVDDVEADAVFNSCHGLNVCRLWTKRADLVLALVSGTLAEWWLVLDSPKLSFIRDIFCSVNLCENK